MSIFSKVRSYLFLVILMCCSWSHAQEVTYSPEFVDTFLIQNTQDLQISQITENVSDTKLNTQPVWDVQNLKISRSAPSVVLILPIIILLIIIIKFLFKSFYSSSLSAIVNGKVFQLHYRNKKFSDIIPLFFLFILRNIVMVIICQYLIFTAFNDNAYLNMRFFLTGFFLMSFFYTLLYAAEFFVQSVIGVSNIYKMYITQYYLITTWCWLPLIGVILILYLNGIHLSLDLIGLFLIIPLLIFAFWAIIRSIILWNGAWRDNLIYFFIYLCTFKIIPYLIIAKYIQDFWL